MNKKVINMKMKIINSAIVYPCFRFVTNVIILRLRLTPCRSLIKKMCRETRDGTRFLGKE